MNISLLRRLIDQSPYKKVCFQLEKQIIETIELNQELSRTLDILSKNEKDQAALKKFAYFFEFVYFSSNSFFNSNFE